MRQSLLFTGLLSALPFLFSACTFQPSHVELRKGSVEAAMRQAAEDGKILVAILQRPDCTPCNILQQHVTQDVSFARENRDALFYSFDIGRPENKWLPEWLHETASPTIAIFDRSGRFLTVVKGGFLDRLRHILAEARLGRLDSIHRYSQTNLLLTGEVYRDVIDAALRGYLQLEGGTGGERDMRQDLERSARIKPYFFNTYLLAKMAKAGGDTATARDYARQALTFNEMMDFRLYTARRSELKYILDDRFSERDEPYAAMDRTEADLGLLQVSDTAAVSFMIRNTGGQPLLIRDVVVSCSCLSVDWPEAPILPGREGRIVAHYRIKDEGLFSQFAHVISNARNGAVVLSVKGRVE